MSTELPSPAVARTDAEEAWRLMAGFVIDHRGDWRRSVAAMTGMPFSRSRALRLLTSQDYTMSDLAAAMASDAPATTLVIDDLERRGLAVRTQRPENRRVRVVSITDAGRQVAASVDDVTVPAPDSLASLPAAALAELVRILRLADA
jgi:DNA-binding MarR family transcriptional regulator